jgi:shikimate dehydrogenase
VSAIPTLAVLGSPIGHSLSPTLHSRAYRMLGLDWNYESVDVTEAGLPSFLNALGDEWRGLSLTMPLKRAILPLLDEHDDLVGLTGVANTVLFDRRDKMTVRGFNTDVAGVMDAVREAGGDAHHAHVLGAGATAASVIVALSRLGATSATVSARSPGKTTALRQLAGRLGMVLTVSPFGGGAAREMPLVISAIPGSAEIDFPIPNVLPGDAVLLDIAYDPWPTPLAAAWSRAGGTVHSGLGMLVYQALRQVRIFVHGDPELALDRESELLDAMRNSVGLPSA